MTDNDDSAPDELDRLLNGLALDDAVRQLLVSTANQGPDALANRRRVVTVVQELLATADRQFHLAVVVALADRLAYRGGLLLASLSSASGKTPAELTEPR
jgi:hypothetical protein